MSKTDLPYLDRLPAGWHVISVGRAGPIKSRKWDWVAFVIDVHPDELKNCRCRMAWLYVDPKDYRPEPGRVAQEAWLRIPGKHRNEDAAWVALEDMLETRH